MVCLDERRSRRSLPPAATLGPPIRDTDLRNLAKPRPSLLLRRSTVTSNTTICSSSTRSAGNFEPAEISAAFGLVQLDKLPGNLAKRKHNFERLTRLFAQRPDVFGCRRTTPEVDTPWHMFPVLIRPIRSAALDLPAAHGTQRHRHPNGLDRKRLRQPAFNVIAHRAPEQRLPNADLVMNKG